MKVVVTSGYFDPLHIGHLECLELAKELQIPLGSNVESILHLVQKAWEKLENSSLEPYFDEHYNSSMNKLSKSNAYIPDVGIPASKLSAILLGDL